MAENQTSARCPSDVMLRSIRQTGAHSGVFERIEIDHAWHRHARPARPTASGSATVTGTRTVLSRPIRLLRPSPRVSLMRAALERVVEQHRVALDKMKDM
jgi:hypothetical protein